MINARKALSSFVALSLTFSCVLPAAAQVRVAAPSGVAGLATTAAGAKSAPGLALAPTSLPGSIVAPGLTGALLAPSAVRLAPASVASALTPSAALPAAATARDGRPVTVMTPGPAGTRIAEEAAATFADAPVDPQPATPNLPQGAPQKKGIMAALAALVRGRSSAAAFDGSADKPAPIAARQGLREQKPVLLPNRTAPDEAPVIPASDREASVVFQTYALPGAQGVGGVFEAPTVLNADPASVDAVVAAVRAAVDANPARYGVPSSELRLIHAKRVEGRGEQADAVFIYFRQIRDNIPVHGSELSFTVKTIGGRAVIAAQTGRIFPALTVETAGVLTDDQVFGAIAARVGLNSAQEAYDAFEFVEQKIIYSRGRWRNAKLYAAEGLPFMVAVDMNDATVFAWDNRAGLRDGGPAAKKGVEGTASGRTVDRGPIMPKSEITEIPLAFLTVKLGGKTFVTDKNGQFVAEGVEIPAEGLEIKASLEGPFTRIEDQERRPVTVTARVLPGEKARVVFNPEASLANEGALAQVNTFHKVNLAYGFLKERGLTNERMDKAAIPARTNIDDECNAYYTPGRPSLNFFRSSKNCVNTGYDTVADHEYGHYWDDMIGGIVNGGMSEGWGDIVSMYLLGNPVIGEHFLKKPRGGVDYIRHGENTYQYNEYDEVHDQGQAWGGFAWKLRKALMAKLGDAEGAAVAESLVLPTMFAKASAIPDAMAQVLVNATQKDGTIMHEAEIRAAARAHGVELPAAPGAAPRALAPQVRPQAKGRFSGLLDWLKGLLK